MTTAHIAVRHRKIPKGYCHIAKYIPIFKPNYKELYPIITGIFLYLWIYFFLKKQCVWLAGVPIPKMLDPN